MVLDNICNKAKNYNLKCQKLNPTTLRVYKPDMLYDSWLITYTKGSAYILLKHKSKVGKINRNKEYYHLQKKILVKDWIWTLQRINSHYRYELDERYENIVDKSLNKYRQERNEKR